LEFEGRINYTLYFPCVRKGGGASMYRVIALFRKENAGAGWSIGTCKAPDEGRNLQLYAY
jgi:hypothetical protein